MERTDRDAPIEKKLQDALVNLGKGEGVPSIMLIVYRERYPFKAKPVSRTTTGSA